MSNKLIIGGAVAAVAAGGIYYGLKHQKENAVTVEKVDAAYTAGLAKFNSYSEQSNFHLVAERKSPTVEVEDGSEIATRIYITSAKVPEGDKTNCVDIKTHIITKGDLGMSTLAKMISTVVSDPAQSDCRWIQDIQSDPDTKEIFENQFGGEVPARLASTFSVAGTQHHTLNVDEANITEAGKENGGLIQWAALVLDVDTNNELSKFDYTLDWPGFEIAKDKQSDERVKMDGFSITGKLSPYSQNIWLGKTDLNIASLFTNIPNDETGEKSIIDVKNIRLDADAQVVNNLLNSGAKLSIGDITIDNKNIGVEYGFYLNKLQPAAFEELMVEGQAMQKSVETEGKPNPESVKQFIAKTLKAFSGADLSIDPIKITADGQSAGGVINITAGDIANLDPNAVLASPLALLPKLSAKMSSAVNDNNILNLALKFDDLSQEEAQNVINNPLALMTKTIANMRLEVTEADIKALETLNVGEKDSGSQPVTDGLMQLTMMGLIKQEGEKFVMDFNMDKGQMLLNGEPLDPAMLQALTGGPSR